MNDSTNLRLRLHRDLQVVISTARAASELLQYDTYTAPSLRQDVAAIEAILARIRQEAEGLTQANPRG